MNLLILTIVSGFIFSIFFTFMFKKLRLVNMNYSNKPVPYSGGTILLFTITASLAVYYAYNEISFFKFLLFSLCLLCIYILGFIDDLYSISQKKEFRKNTKYFLNTEFLIYLFEMLGSIISVFYVFYIFNDDFWLYRAIITLLLIKGFNLLGNKPGRALKAYYFFMLILNLSILQWTNELFITSILAASVYYFFDACSCSMLGSSGQSILGLTLGMIYSEALRGNTKLYFLSIIFLSLVCLLLKVKSLSNVFKTIGLLKYLDRLLTIREGENLLQDPSCASQYESHKSIIEKDSAINSEQH